MLLYSPGQGQTIHWGQHVDVNRKALSCCPFVASLKNLLNSDFIHIFHAFIHVHSPGAGADNPLRTLRTTFRCQQKYLVTSVICCKFLP